MRKRERYSLVLLALLLCVCLLTGCQKETQVSGEVVEARFDANHTLVSLIVQNDDGKRVGVFVTGDTWIISLVDGFTAETFKTEQQTDTVITAHFTKDKKTVTEANGEKLVYYTAQQINILGVIERGADVLSDGTSVDRMQDEFRNTVYRLADGTELLSVAEPYGPNNVYVGGLKNWDDLSVAAQGKVLAFYTERGLLYEEHEELEKAYADYQARGAKDFSCRSVMQNVVPSAYNAHVMYFLTDATSSVYGSQVCLGDAFDRETGEHIDNMELFTCAPEEAKKALLDAACAGLDDPALRSEMDKAFQWEYMVLTPAGIEITFPAGTLPGQEDSYIAVLELGGSIGGILQEWAVPIRAE